MPRAGPHRHPRATLAGQSRALRPSPWRSGALDPQIDELLVGLAAGGGGTIADMSLSDARKMLVLGASFTAGSGARVADVSDLIVSTTEGDVPVRVYRPPTPVTEPPGMLIWFHGGGFALGDLESADPTARDLCAGGGVVVASVDYPLAPEHPWPAAPRTCLAVTTALAAMAGELGVDPARLAVGGDSAGGNLAALTAIGARDAGGPALAWQLLVYPTTDLTGSYPSVRSNGEGYFLTAADMAWFGEQYLPAGTDATDPAVSPVYANLDGLPPAHVLTAEFDPLRDEGEAYAELLRRAGVPVEAERIDGMVHGFFSMPAVSDRAAQVLRATTTALRAALGA